jgi:voltage-gated potassium channel Kch
MKYITALYWSFQTLTSVGYGDVGSVTITERIITIIYMSFGVGFYSMTLNDIGSMIQSLDAE